MCRRNNVVHMEMTFCNKAMQAMQARCHTSPIRILSRPRRNFLIVQKFIKRNLRIFWHNKIGQMEFIPYQVLIYFKFC